MKETTKHGSIDVNGDNSTLNGRSFLDYAWETFERETGGFQEGTVDVAYRVKRRLHNIPNVVEAYGHIVPAPITTLSALPMASQLQSRLCKNKGWGTETILVRMDIVHKHHPVSTLGFIAPRRTFPRYVPLSLLIGKDDMDTIELEINKVKVEVTLCQNDSNYTSPGYSFGDMLRYVAGNLVPEVTGPEPEEGGEE